MAEEKKQKLIVPNGKYITLISEGRGAYNSVFRETHEIIYGISVEGHRLREQKMIFEPKSEGEWIKMDDFTCREYFENKQEWMHVPISQIVHRVEYFLNDFDDYRITLDPSKGLVVSRSEVFPHEEISQGSRVLPKLPGLRDTANKWKHSHAHNLWFRAAKSDELDQLVKTLSLEGFKEASKGNLENHYLIEDPIHVFSEAIRELLKDISTYNRMKYFFRDGSSLNPCCFDSILYSWKDRKGD